MGMRIGKQVETGRRAVVLFRKRSMPYEVTTNHGPRNTAIVVYPTVRHPKLSEIERVVMRYSAASNGSLKESCKAEEAVRKANRTALANRAPQPLNAGERTNPAGKPVSNAILLALPEEEFDAIRPHLQFVSLPQRLSLQEANQKLDDAYFLNRGMVSLVFTTQKGESVEVGVVGNEGFTPIPVTAGLRRSPHRAVMQIGGEGFKINVSELATVLESSPALRSMLNRYAAVHGLQVAQTAGCNRLHDIEQRLSRWLLLAQDRVDSGLLRITHDFLAMMLGTDRPSVSLAAGGLQKKRIIEYTRGSVRILNRKKLESSACECYGIIQQFTGELALR
jgi:CRP-like cAMP-binding protein